MISPSVGNVGITTSYRNLSEVKEFVYSYMCSMFTRREVLKNYEQESYSSWTKNYRTELQQHVYHEWETVKQLGKQMNVSVWWWWCCPPRHVRRATRCRWVVELINGRMKRDFNLFRQEYFNMVGRHLMKDFIIGWNGIQPSCAGILLWTGFSELIIHKGRKYKQKTSNFPNIDGNKTLEDLKRQALGTF